ncbi:MAG: hypothetical protein LRS46_02030 [Desulfurococcales archaeon]|nr:hypothetical protein [Desulfurococcales archaeon]
MVRADHALRSLHYEMLTRSAQVLARCCRDLKLQCRDPPLTTTTLLFSLGYNQYQIREFWQTLEDIGELSYEIYRWGGAVFIIRLLHVTGPLRETRCGDYKIPVDLLDSKRVYYEYAPRAHQVYVYVEGGYSGVGLKINVARILSIMAVNTPKLLDSLLNAVIDEAWGRGRGLPGIVASLLHSWGDTLKFILPRIPRSQGELLALSPLLRRHFKGDSSTANHGGA